MFTGQNYICKHRITNLYPETQSEWSRKCPHFVNALFSHFVTASFFHFAVALFFHFVKASFSQFVTGSFSQFVTASFSNFVTASFFHFGTASFSHFVTASFFSICDSFIFSLCHFFIAGHFTNVKFPQGTTVFIDVPRRNQFNKVPLCIISLIWRSLILGTFKSNFGSNRSAMLIPTSMVTISN